MKTVKEIPFLHVITIKFISSSKSRILLRSEKFKQSKIINYDYYFNNIHEIAQNYLEKNGFNIIGLAEGKDCYYLISTTFKNL